MKRQSKTPYALLGILSQCEMSGYEIKKFTEDNLSFFWKESFGQIYPTLKTLESKGWVISREENLPEGSRSKILYKITKLGIQELKKWLEGKTAKSTLRNEFLLKLFFARAMEPKKLLEQIHQERLSAESDYRIYKAIESRLQSTLADHPDYKYWNFTLEYGLESTRMTLKWLSKIEKEIAGSKL